LVELKAKFILHGQYHLNVFSPTILILQQLNKGLITHAIANGLYWT